MFVHHHPLIWILKFEFILYTQGLRSVYGIVAQWRIQEFEKGVWDLQLKAREAREIFTVILIFISYTTPGAHIGVSRIYKLL